MEYHLAAKIKIIKDVFFGLTLYDNFDNNSSSSSTTKNDWG